MTRPIPTLTLDLDPEVIRTPQATPACVEALAHDQRAFVHTAWRWFAHYPPEHVSYRAAWEGLHKAGYVCDAAGVWQAPAPTRRTAAEWRALEREQYEPQPTPVRSTPVTLHTSAMGRRYADLDGTGVHLTAQCHETGEPVLWLDCAVLRPQDAAALLPLLQHFIAHGTLPAAEEGP